MNKNFELDFLSPTNRLVDLKQRNNKIEVAKKELDSKDMLKIFLPSINLQTEQLSMNENPFYDLIKEQAECPICSCILNDPVDCKECEVTLC